MNILEQLAELAAIEKRLEGLEALMGCHPPEPRGHATRIGVTFQLDKNTTKERITVMVNIPVGQTGTTLLQFTDTATPPNDLTQEVLTEGPPTVVVDNVAVAVALITLGSTPNPSGQAGQPATLLFASLAVSALAVGEANVTITAENQDGTYLTGSFAVTGVPVTDDATVINAVGWTFAPTTPAATPGAKNGIFAGAPVASAKPAASAKPKTNADGTTPGTGPQ